MCWIKSNKMYSTEQEGIDGGEELFVMNGSLVVEEEEYHKWGWLRFPVGGDSRRASLKAGPAGAQVYRKMNHLTEKALSMEKIQIAEDETVKM